MPRDYSAWIVIGIAAVPIAYIFVVLVVRHISCAYHEGKISAFVKQAQRFRKSRTERDETSG